MEALVSVNTREALLSDIREEVERCGRAFLHDTSSTDVNESHITPLLNLLNRLRLESVKCVECIDRWRDHQASMRRLSSGVSEDGKGMWAVTVQVTGKQLYKESPAFRSSVSGCTLSHLSAPLCQSIISTFIPPNSTSRVSTYIGQALPA